MATLIRFLRARGGDVYKATELVKEDLAWRASYRPQDLRCRWIETQATTGKMRVSDTYDVHGRPVIVMHHKYENSKDETGQVQYLVWTLEHAIRRMTPPVSKYSVFINQEGFSLFSGPSMKVSKEVAKCLSGRYPERLGHAVIWQPPFYFRAFYKIISPFIDTRTKQKILMVHGEYGPGSENDRAMTNIFGPNWRIICGIDQPQEADNIAPGYSHSVAWDKIQRFEQAYFVARNEQERQAARDSIYGPAPVSPDTEVARLVSGYPQTYGLEAPVPTAVASPVAAASAAAALAAAAGASPLAVSAAASAAAAATNVANSATAVPESAESKEGLELKSDAPSPVPEEDGSLLSAGGARSDASPGGSSPAADTAPQSPSSDEALAGPI